jgi:hypothetical protein
MQDYLTQLRQMKKMGGIEGNNVFYARVFQK